MNRSLFYLTLALFWLITSCTSSPKPNIVFILVDDLGWKDLGCYGSDFYDTPELASRLKSLLHRELDEMGAQYPESK